MAFLAINNVAIRGMACGIPRNTEDNMDYPYLSKEELEEYVQSTGVRYRHCTTPDICTSDLCESAAEELLKSLSWCKDEIEALVFVSATPDYKMPATACVLQDKMGLPSSCLAFDVNLGCSGFVYGLSIISSYMQTGQIKKALLLVGNTQHKNCYPKDKSTYLIIGDGGSATALEYEEGVEQMKFSLSTYGYGKDALMVHDGGCRFPVDTKSLEEYTDEVGTRRLIDFRMDGGDVFAFVMSHVVKCFKEFLEHYDIEDEKVDYYLLHHASKMSCNKIHKKLHLPDEKVPYNFYDFGNSSNACIPLLMTTNIREQLSNGKIRLFISGFGTGLSVGLGYIVCDHIIVPELIQV